MYGKFYCSRAITAWVTHQTIIGLLAAEHAAGRTDGKWQIYMTTPSLSGGDIKTNKHTGCYICRLDYGIAQLHVMLEVCRLQLNSARFLYLATVLGVGGPGAIITAALRGVALQAHTCNRGQIYRRWHTHNYRFPKSTVVKSWNFIWLLNCPPFKPDSWKQRDDSLNDFIYDYLERLLVFCQLLTQNRA